MVQPVSPFNPWYVCLTKPRQEAYAASKLQEQGFECYLPHLHRWQRLAGGWKKSTQVMFPRYAFVRPANERQAVGPIRSTPGVSTLVSFGHVLACMPAPLLAALREVEATQAAALQPLALAPGQRVVLMAGPLKGLEGLVSHVAAQRVSVMLSLLGKEHKVQVSLDSLALAAPA